MYIYIYIYIYIDIYCSFSFAVLKAHENEAALFPHSPVPLNFGGRKRSGVFNAVWPSARNYRQYGAGEKSRLFTPLLFKRYLPKDTHALKKSKQSLRHRYLKLCFCFCFCFVRASGFKCSLLATIRWPDNIDHSAGTSPRPKNAKADST